MQTFETIQEADADKMLRLNIPVEKGSCRYHVLVAMQPDPTAVASALHRIGRRASLNGRRVPGGESWCANPKVTSKRREEL